MADKHVAWTTCLHEFDGQTEETAGFVVDHLDVFFFCGTSQTISPEKIHPLSTMKIDQLVSYQPSQKR